MPRQIGHDLSEKARTEDIHILENVSFSELVTDEVILQGLHSSGFKKPSPIQLKAIPIGRVGFDMVMQAKSGTGKTIVFTVLALEQIDLKNNHVQALIIAPTREIAVQITDVITHVGKEKKGLKVKTFIGGVSFVEDKQNVRNCHIAVGAPGRLKHLIESKHLNTSEIRFLVLDEADKLLEPNFQKSINYIFNKLPTSKQIVASSATYPQELQNFLTLYMRSPIHVSPDPQASVVLLGLRQFISVVKYNPSVTIQMETKIEELFRLLRFITFRQCLVFSNYHLRAESICTRLSCNGWPAVWISSKMDQKKRNEAIESLREFRCRVLLSTDLTARGIDIENVNLVINLDVPYNSSTYLHRIGRAGRYGSHGIVIQMVAEGEELQTFRKILGLIGGEEQFVMKLPSDVLPKELWSTDDISFEKVHGITYTAEEEVLMSPYQFEVKEFMNNSKLAETVTSHTASTLNGLSDTRNQNLKACEVNCTSPVKYNEQLVEDDRSKVTEKEYTDSQKEIELFGSALPGISNCKKLSTEGQKDALNQIDSNLHEGSGIFTQTPHIDSHNTQKSGVTVQEKTSNDALKRKKPLLEGDTECCGFTSNSRDTLLKYNSVVSDIANTLVGEKKHSKLDPYTQLNDSLVVFKHNAIPNNKTLQPEPVYSVGVEHYQDVYDSLNVECQAIIQDVNKKALQIKTKSLLAHLVTGKPFKPGCEFTLQDKTMAKVKNCRKKNKVDIQASVTEHSSTNTYTDNVCFSKSLEHQLHVVDSRRDSSTEESSAANEQIELSLDKPELINSSTSSNAVNNFGSPITLIQSSNEHANFRANTINDLPSSLMPSEGLKNASNTCSAEKTVNDSSVPFKSNGFPNSHATKMSRDTEKKPGSASFSQIIFDQRRRRRDCRSAVSHSKSSDSDLYEDGSKVPQAQAVRALSTASDSLSQDVCDSNSEDECDVPSTYQISNHSCYPCGRDGIVPTHMLSSRGSASNRTKEQCDSKVYQTRQHNKSFVTSQIPHSCEFHNVNIPYNNAFTSPNLSYGSRRMKNRGNTRCDCNSSCNHIPQPSSSWCEAGWQNYLSKYKQYDMLKMQVAHNNQILYYNEYWKCMLHRKW